MKTIGILEATNSLSQLVDQAASGEEVVLTRNGKPVARLAPMSGAKQQTTGMDWLAQSCAARMARGAHGA
ncbi:MAG TPA: type II toxin-antitoxin system prevent-host-death family antitoxin [Rhodocyclaceae bacterium]